MSLALWQWWKINKAWCTVVEQTALDCTWTATWHRDDHSKRGTLHCFNRKYNAFHFTDLFVICYEDSAVEMYFALVWFYSMFISVLYLVHEMYWNLLKSQFFSSLTSKNSWKSKNLRVHILKERTIYTVNYLYNIFCSFLNCTLCICGDCIIVKNIYNFVVEWNKWLHCNKYLSPLFLRFDGE